MVHHLSADQGKEHPEVAVEHHDVRIHPGLQAALGGVGADEAGREQRRHAESVLQGQSRPPDDVADRPVHGEYASGQGAVGEAAGAVAHGDGSIVDGELLGRSSHRRHGVGDQHGALDALGPHRRAHCRRV